MRITASSWYELYFPTRCEKRPRLIAAGEIPREKDPYAELLVKLGRRYEEQYLSSLPAFEDMRGGTEDERMQKTFKAIQDHVPVIYQPFFKTWLNLEGEKVEVVGEPDFLIWDGNGYLIRDVKIARRVTQKDKPQIWHQLQAYGVLFQSLMGEAPKSLQVYNGLGEILPFDYMGLESFAWDVIKLIRIQQGDPITYEPVGVSKCQQCPFKSKCWSEAEARQDVSLCYNIDQEAARTLWEGHITTIKALAEMDEVKLAEMKVKRGTTERRMGRTGLKAIQMAQAVVAGKAIVLSKPDLPEGENFVIFDIEGIPEGYDDLTRIYLWGCRLYSVGKDPGPYIGATADLSTDWDRESWFMFLREIGKIFGEYGDIPLIHWHHYERTHVQKYLERYGDIDGTAQRVLNNLLDLLPICKESIALPLYSYSLKVVEKWVGFKRSQDEYGGSWSIVEFIEAIETNDPAMRKEKLDGILIYNFEDLEATWQVYLWLRSMAA
jgi:uncharacterized protein